MTADWEQSDFTLVTNTILKESLPVFGEHTLFSAPTHVLLVMGFEQLL